MPELPEVETIARQLDGVIRGKKIKTINVLRGTSFQGEVGALVGQTVKRVDRHAKMVVWYLEESSKVVLIHLKMTGQLIYDSKKDVGSMNHTVVGGHPNEDWIVKHPTKHTRVIIGFSDGSFLYFNDLRVFGWMKLLNKEDFDKQLSKLPPDVNAESFSFEYFNKVLDGSSRAIKLTIMDSNRIGGAGNIYANDALNLSKIDPRRKAKDLTLVERKSLYVALIDVIDKGIKYGGASASNYVHVTGLGGKYQEHFLVYNREGEECKNCGGAIKKNKLGGRGTYFCDDCQK